jgi:aminopeptidase-like protein
MTWDELNPFLHTLPEQPEAIPYVTSYYSETWGFCLSYNEYKSLPREGNYEVLIDSTLEDGELIYGEAVLPGSSEEEVLFSTYICHPSMANNELSGPLVQSFLYEEIAQMPNRRYSYRFVFLPETIGAICYLARLGDHFKKSLRAGYVLTCCGDEGHLHFKKSRMGDSVADRAMEHVLKFKTSSKHAVEEFSVGGSDERQYCSPGFNLPVGSLMRTPYQRYPEYHTSLDNKELISFEAMSEVVACYFEAVRVIELNDCYVNTVQYGEPQLGKRGLYPSVNSPEQRRKETHQLMHLLAYADGQCDLIEIADKRQEYARDYEGHVQSLLEAQLLIRK